MCNKGDWNSFQIHFGRSALPENTFSTTNMILSISSRLKKKMHISLAYTIYDPLTVPHIYLVHRKALLLARSNPHFIRLLLACLSLKAN